MVCYIMRGIPGSGKTTRARELVQLGGIIHSTNDHFVKNGNYQFITALVGWNHHRNFSDFRKSIRRKIAVVVVDNCNVKVSEFEHYVDFAETYGYKVTVVEMPHLDPIVATRRSPHYVPLVNIERMLATFEPYKV